MKTLRPVTASLGGLVLAWSMAAGVAAAGSEHAAGTFIDVGGATVGWAKLVQDGSGRVHLNVHVEGLTPGLHGIHIHEIGACLPTFGAAGGHYNPGGLQHGLDNPNGPHAGDLPNLIVNAEGVGHLDAVTDRVTLSPGPTTLFDATGSALVIHANTDDQVTNAGNGGSGNRVACAVIAAD